MFNKVTKQNGALHNKKLFKINMFDNKSLF